MPTACERLADTADALLEGDLSPADAGAWIREHLCGPGLEQ